MHNSDFLLLVRCYETERTQKLAMKKIKSKSNQNIYGVKDMLTDKEQKEYILSKIQKSVHFKYPEEPTNRKGVLLDRFVIKDTEDNEVVYWNLIDLIKFEHDEENWLRITYYRYKKQQKRWVFAGQTSLSDPISKFEELFVNAIREKEWVRHLFKEILQKCVME